MKHNSLCGKRRLELRDPRSLSRQAFLRPRRCLLERLEDRSLMTGMPYGALPDDTGEYMLGDVHVTVVLMESDSTMSPFDVSTEDWTAGEIADVKSRVTTGLNWWKETLDAMPDVRDGLLTFDIDFQYADSPVHTGYEPIRNRSNMFSTWVKDFLQPQGFDQSSNYQVNLRAFNNAQRIAHNSNWAFTIFVVDDSNDLLTDFTTNSGGQIISDGRGRFASGGSFSQSFAFAGGIGFVMPANRPPEIVAHETGHIFWALDEYGSSSSTLHRGYYDTSNYNAASNPADDFVQQDSIMAAGYLVENAFAAHTSSTSSLETIGWKDSDGDGIFDVLDVPFSLTGTGNFSPTNSVFHFTGNSKVRTFQNKNPTPASLQDDITINQIDQAEYSIDGGAWTVAGTYHKYETDLDLYISIPAGAQQIKIRTADVRTGVMSDEFVANLDGRPHSSPGSGINGFVYSDGNQNSIWDSGELGLGGWAVNLVDSAGNPLNLRQKIEPNDYSSGAILNSVRPGIALSAIGDDALNSTITAGASYSAPTAGNVFFVESKAQGPVDTWSSGRQFKISFTQPITTLSIRALSSGAPTVGRLEVYNSGGQLLQRYTTDVLTAGKSEVMKISRPQEDIAYAIARGFGGTFVVLDSLEVGAESSTSTNSLGAFSLPELGSQQYYVSITAKPNYILTSPGSNKYPVTVGSSQGVQNIVFSYHSIVGPWQNPENPLDVNGDHDVTAIDALNVINWINANPGLSQLAAARQIYEKFYDVNNDGFCTAGDALLVINWINNHPMSPPVESEGPSTVPTPGTTSPLGFGSGEADGEESPVVPSLAANYYATNPLHREVEVDSIGCVCGQCTAINDVAVGRVQDTVTAVQSTSISTPRPASLSGHLSKSKPASSGHLDEGLLHALAGNVVQATQSNSKRPKK